MALLTRIRTTLRLHDHRRIVALFDGAHRGLPLGRGSDFNDLRAYVPGDALSDMDWKATARTGAPLVRRYHADQQHRLVLGVTVGRTMAAHASVETSKRDLLLHVVGGLADLAVAHGDRVQTCLADVRRQPLARPVTRLADLEQMLRNVRDRCTVDAPAGDVEVLVTTIARGVRHRSLLVLVLDDVALADSLVEKLRLLRARHVLAVVFIGDIDPTDTGGRPVVDLERGTELADFLLADPELVAEFRRHDSERAAARAEALDRMGIPHATVRELADVAPAIVGILRRSPRAG